MYLSCINFSHLSITYRLCDISRAETSIITASTFLPHLARQERRVIDVGVAITAQPIGQNKTKEKKKKRLQNEPKRTCETNPEHTDTAHSTHRHTQHSTARTQ
jgi:hypothetical protein